jgi:hypothetical protein
MGMIFNGPVTTEMLNKMSSRYGLGALTGHRGDQVILDDRVHHRRTHDAARDLQLTSSINDKKWAAWLDWMDGTLNANQTTDFGKQIRDLIVLFLKDNNCLAIEFHPVPAAAISVIKNLNYPIGTTGTYSGSITINTIPYDQVVPPLP